MRPTVFALCAGLLLAGSARADFQMFPSSNLYPHYIADPRRPEFGLTILGFPDPEIPDSGDRRVGLKLGGRFGLLRLGGWQVNIEAGFTGQFDIEHSLDNIGWDGTYGFLVSSALGNGVSVQLGTKHISSHVGDEYVCRAAWAGMPRSTCNPLKSAIGRRTRHSRPAFSSRQATAAGEWGSPSMTEPSPSASTTAWTRPTSPWGSGWRHEHRRRPPHDS